MELELQSADPGWNKGERMSDQSDSLHMQHTTRYSHLFLPFAEDRYRWKLLHPKVK